MAGWYSTDLIPRSRGGGGGGGGWDLPCPARVPPSSALGVEGPHTLPVLPFRVGSVSLSLSLSLSLMEISREHDRPRLRSLL